MGKEKTKEKQIPGADLVVMEPELIQTVSVSETAQITTELEPVSVEESKPEAEPKPKDPEQIAEEPQIADEPMRSKKTTESTISEWKKWYFKEFLASPVLSEIVRLYIENEGKENLYDVIRAYIKKHPKRRDKIMAQLAADKERYVQENLGKIAAATGVLSVTGALLAVTGTAERGALVVLLVVLAVVSGYVGLYAAKNTECRHMIIFIEFVLHNSDKKWKSKNL